MLLALQGYGIKRAFVTKTRRRPTVIVEDLTPEQEAEETFVIMSLLEAHYNFAPVDPKPNRDE